MEKAMIQQLNLYLETHCPLPDTVCAYRKNLSTECTILKLLDTIYKNMDKQCVTLVMAIHLSAAFETVNHSLLLKVLNQTYNIKGTTLRWFTSYLSDHSVCVQINNRVSQELDRPFLCHKGLVQVQFYLIYILVALPVILVHQTMTNWAMQTIIQFQPA